jgi:hypothetical protein
MFCLSLLFLALVAAVIVLRVDVPRLSIRLDAERVEGSAAEDSATESSPYPDLAAYGSALDEATPTASALLVLLLAVLWTLFVAEFGLQYLLRDRTKSFWKARYYGLILCVCPPLRLCARNHDMDGRIWLPTLGWHTVDQTLRERLERQFSGPMIVIAMMILPVLLVEFAMKEQIAAHLWLQVLVHTSTGLIWLAFAIEFIVMVTVADSKFRYCREHWLDLAIIMLPLISFLRSLRVVRAVRVARLARIPLLTKMIRLYRLRGLAMRVFRAVLLLELLNRVLRVTPEKKLDRLREQLREKEKEAEALRCEIAALEAELERCQKGKAK